jgi:hypothetical protein
LVLVERRARFLAADEGVIKYKAVGRNNPQNVCDAANQCKTGKNEGCDARCRRLKRAASTKHLSLANSVNEDISSTQCDRYGSDISELQHQNGSTHPIVRLQQ